jgi:hypothetical protein
VVRGCKIMMDIEAEELRHLEVGTLARMHLN